MKPITTKNYEIFFNKAYFEHNAYGEDEAGSMWFNSNGVLTDYDGVFELPKEIIAAFEQLGYNMDWAKDDV